MNTHVQTAPLTGGDSDGLDDPLGLEHQRRRVSLWVLGLIFALLTACIAGVAIGAVSIDPRVIVQVIAHHASMGQLFTTPVWTTAEDAIVWEVRLPRVILGAVVGAGLAVCGLVLQAMVRNPLADPHLLGINSGASCGAAAAILFGLGMGLSAHALQLTAFLGALVAALAVYGLARTGGPMSSLKLLLAGVAVGYALNALTSFLVFLSGDAEGTRSVMFWLLGSLSSASWGSPLLAVVTVTACALTVLWAQARRIDALSIGDGAARSLGVNPERQRTLLLVIVAACIGVLVSAAGSIGFVGLVVPHLARALVGAGHRHNLPVAALLGAVLLVLADLAARTVLQPQELPIGIITALLGTPFLILLIRRTRTA
nr:iron ABC transporter permease [Corynebacterium halotolerans]